MRADAMDALVQVREGAPLASALAGKKRFPGLLAMFSRLGEQTGQLPLMLERAARQLGTEVQRRALQMATILEPLLIVAMGARGDADRARGAAADHPVQHLGEVTRRWHANCNNRLRFAPQFGDADRRRLCLNDHSASCMWRNRSMTASNDLVTVSSRRRGGMPIARMRNLYRVDAGRPPSSTSCRRRNTKRLRSTYERMLEKGPERFQVKPSGLPVMDHLYDELPNFTEVLDDIRRQLALCEDSARCARDHATSAARPAGRRQDPFRARTRGAAWHRHGLSVDELDDSRLGAESGASSQWKGARPGKVFETLVDGQYANPVMVVDEIDKAGGEHAYDPLGALYGLLEHDTAGSFTDEFAEVPIDASQVIWVATANDGRAIPRPDPEPHERLRGAGARPRRGAPHRRQACTAASAPSTAGASASTPSRTATSSMR